MDSSGNSHPRAVGAMQMGNQMLGAGWGGVPEGVSKCLSMMPVAETAAGRTSALDQPFPSKTHLTCPWAIWTTCPKWRVPGPHPDLQNQDLLRFKVAR